MVLQVMYSITLILPEVRLLLLFLQQGAGINPR